MEKPSPSSFPPAVNGGISCKLCHYNNNDATYREHSHSQACLDLSSWEGVISGADGTEHESLIDLENPSDNLILKRKEATIYVSDDNQ